MISIILAILLNTPMNVEVEKPKLIYVGDPMCSWCYGISEELSKTINHYGDRIELELVMGGLRAGGGEEWNTSFKEFLRHHWEEIGMLTGQSFSFALLDKTEFDYDTEPACRSIVAVGEIDESKMLSFFKEVQKGFYLEGRDPKSVEFYRPICNEMEIDFSVFSTKFESIEVKANTKKHFQRANYLGARSFPTLLLEHKGQLYMIASGYSKFEKLKLHIDAVVK